MDTEFTGQSLTRRQVEIMELVAKGLTYKQIGEQLFLSERTVRTHIFHVMQAVDAQNRVEALYKLGWIVSPATKDLLNALRKELK
jgi:DNA-binding NarL/FixJ family response regulator